MMFIVVIYKYVQCYKLFSNILFFFFFPLKKMYLKNMLIKGYGDNNTLFIKLFWTWFKSVRIM